MAFIGNPALASSAPISNDGFWPDLLTGDLMAKYRIPSEYEGGVIETGLIMAMIQVNAQLEAVKQTIIDLGHADLDAYIATKSQLIGGKEVLLSQYEHAVYTRAKAGLLQQFKTMNRRKIAETEAKESDETELYWLDQSQSMIKQFFDLLIPLNSVVGKANTHVALL